MSLKDQDLDRAVIAAVPSPGYTPTSPIEIAAGIAGKQREAWAISNGRLWVDCGRAVARFAPRYRNDAAESLRTDAMHLIIRWPSHGGNRRADGTRTERIDLGGLMALRMARGHAIDQPNRGRGVVRWIAEVERLTERGSLPRRRDWIADETAPHELSIGAWRALRAAVQQAADNPAYRLISATAADPIEISTDPLDLDAAVEEQQRDSGEVERVTDLESIADMATAEYLAEHMRVPLSIGRAIVARCYPAESVEAWAQRWAIDRQSAANAISRGQAAILKRWPLPTELIDAIDAAGLARHYRETSESEAILALLAWRDSDPDVYDVAAIRADARESVLRWDGCHRAMTDQQRALIGAIRSALRRHGAPIDRDELIAQSIKRLLPAETRRARGWTYRTAPMAYQRETIAHGATVAGWNGLTPSRARRSSDYGRSILYSRTARRDTEERDTDRAEMIPAIERPRPRPTGEHGRNGEIQLLRRRVQTARDEHAATMARRAEMMR